jgi:ADP-ribosylglycohydrolase
MPKLIRDKVLGAFLGSVIGDCLGLPLECWTKDKIKKHYPNRIENYISNPLHKYYSNCPPATSSDDTQLLYATAYGLWNGLDFNEIAKQHKYAFCRSTLGWGTTTSLAVQNLFEGISYKKSGIKGGMGNGVVMKLLPLATFLLKNPSVNEINALRSFTKMTHDSKEAFLATKMHFNAIRYCLKNDSLNRKLFLNNAIKSVNEKKILENHNFINLYLEKTNPHESYDGGKPYVLSSLFYSYHYFLNNPNSINCMYDCIHNGGDTDTNASIIGGLLGALNGTKIFPKHLLENDEVSKMYCFANLFLSKLKI